jgi:hypothetical protein
MKFYDVKKKMYNRVIYRFIVSRVDEHDIHKQSVFKRFMEMYEDVYFAGIPIKLSFSCSQMNKKAIYIHAAGKYPYEVCMDDEDYNEENAVLTGIDITDNINDKCLDNLKNGIVAVLDMVLVNDINCSDSIDALMVN